MSKVLVPIDGSDNSKNVINYVIDMYQNHHSMEVTLLTVGCLVDLQMGSDFLTDSTMLISACQNKFKKILDEGKKMFDDAGVPVETIIDYGDPAQVIVNMVKEKDITTVIMGTRGLSNILTVVMGSVSRKVVANVKVPVTLVK